MTREYSCNFQLQVLSASVASVCGALGSFARVFICEAVVMIVEVFMVWVSLLVMRDFQVRLDGVLWRLGEVCRFCVCGCQCVAKGRVEKRRRKLPQDVTCPEVA